MKRKQNVDRVLDNQCRRGHPSFLTCGLSSFIASLRLTQGIDEIDSHGHLLKYVEINETYLTTEFFFPHCILSVAFPSFLSINSLNGRPPHHKLRGGETWFQARTGNSSKNLVCFFAPHSFCNPNLLLPPTVPNAIIFPSATMLSLFAAFLGLPWFAHLLILLSLVPLSLITVCMSLLSLS